MRLEALKLRGFRNYRALDLELPPGVVVFVGHNGQGKTNLVEALHILLRGESFRPATAETLRNHEFPEGGKISLKALIAQNKLRHEIDLTMAAGKKTLFWNGNRVPASTLARTFPLVLFSPESLMAIKSGPEQRRVLLDELLITHSASSVKILRDYRRALRARNRLLRDARDGVTPKNQARAILESLDPNFLPLAAELAFNRLCALRDLHSDFQRAVAAVLEDSAVDISVEYLVSRQNACQWSRSDILSAMHKRALELRENELLSGVSLVGPHKHDIRFLFAGKDSRFFCSQGQQRALILSFKMAQILYHHRAHQVYPFLLLDDVLSELDPVRRSNLVKFLKDIPAQIFLTATDLSFSTDFGAHQLSVFDIDRGMVSARETEGLRRIIDSSPGGP